MAWFDHKEPSKLAPARFDDVTRRQQRQPSWLSPGLREETPVAIALPGPPPLPTDLASATPRQPAIPTADVQTHFKPDTREVPVATTTGEASRPSMSPAELETLVAERALHAAVEKTLETGRNAMADALQQLEAVHERLVAELTSRATELAMLVAKRVIARELKIEKNIVVDLVREALDVLNSRDHVRVHLGSEFAVMQDGLVAQYSAMGTLIDVIVDDTLPAFGCVVETDVGSVDESIESRLAALLDAVAGSEGE